ncbi:MAG: trigger factor [Candidatus Acetothermia bacterium]
MKSKLAEEEGNEITLAIEIESERVDSTLSEVYQKSVQEMEIPGFRKGKVPKSFIKARFGDDVFHEQAQEELIGEFLPEAWREHGIKPVSEPEIDVEQFEEGKKFLFKATAEVLPQVELGQYKGLELSPVEIESSIEDRMEKELEHLREEHAQVVPKEGDTVEPGDIVLLEDSEGNRKQVEVPEEDSDTPLAELLGHQTGDSITLDSQEDVEQFEIAEVKQLDLPELDDEFARDLEYDDLSALKSKVKTDLLSQLEEEREEQLHQQILDRVAEYSDFEPPQKMIENIASNRMESLSEQVGEESFDDLLSQEGKTREEMKEQIAQSAEQELKRELLLGEIAEEEGISVSEEELEQRLEEEAQDRGIELLKFKNQLKAEDKLEGYRKQFEQEKVLEFLMNHAQIQEDDDDE